MPPAFVSGKTRNFLNLATCVHVHVWRKIGYNIHVLALATAVFVSAGKGGIEGRSLWHIIIIILFTLVNDLVVMVRALGAKT